MDWFLRWPRNALIQVAQHFLAEYDIKCSPETKNQMVQVSRNELLAGLQFNIWNAEKMVLRKHNAQCSVYHIEILLRSDKKPC